MDRRSFFSAAGLGAGVLAAASSRAQEAAARAENGEGDLRIEDVRVILTAPARIRLAIVKVITNQPGLYGLGCATFTQRIRLAAASVEQYLKPFLIGKDPRRIEDVWQSSFVSSYWRNGPVLNNGMSGVDMALWDLLGKRAGLPLYELFGGKTREAVDVYRHASGRSLSQVEDSARRYIEQGYRHVRVQMSIPGNRTYGAGAGRGADAWEPAPYCRAIPELFAHLRETLGDEVELLHDVHERVPPILAIQLVKDLEPYRLFFLEDPFSPEDVGYFEHLRAQTSTPIAMGELFNNPHEWQSLITGRLIDFIRCHLSQIGGLTPARKLAAQCEPFGVRTAWHGPGDTSPVGHAANVHLDLATTNFGVQEARDFNDAEREVFPGCPTLSDGYYHVGDAPGLGIDVDEAAAAKYPIRDDPPFDLQWGDLRRRDGSIAKP